MKIVISDVDETVVDHSSNNIEDILILANVVKRNNIPFTFATGRPYKHMRNLLKLFDPFLPVVLNNGATIFLKDEVVFNRYVSVDHMIDLISKLHNLGFLILFSDDFDEYQDVTKIPPTGKFPQSTYRRPKRLVDHLQEGKHVNRILFRDTEQKYSDLIAELETSNLNDHFTITTYGQYQIEFSPKFIDKASGLQYVQTYYDIDSTSIAIGNAPNDIQMLQYADIGIAVSNASRRVLEVADIITEGAYAKGVIEGISKYYLEA
ncbi:MULTISPECIES: HAD-IIB family hydrolase [Facklamia]|uniref:HAD-IIB family hydrolase n=1 Tax=Facklamia sp. HMSC062C11 TaxID=1739262 RepID=UPI0008A19481|nr:HAD family hydrolase [Facklamia sp. HMSC062C11]OFL65557.1 hypothetical protein HMPREF2758_01660 [Facklamia sp. HMSC062C11]